MTYTQPFERVYSHYPLKKGKFQAQKTWTKLNDEGSLPDEDTLIKSIQTQKKERTFLKSQNRFIPEWKHFSTWLNSGCYDDECELPVVRAIADYRPGTITINTLDRALNVLRDHGQGKFDEFCRHLKFSKGDIESVLNKHSGNYDIRRLAGGIG